MDRFTLASVAPVSIGVHQATWDQAGSHPRHQYRQPRRNARQRLLAAILPARDPETCDVACEFDAHGELEGVVVRDVASGHVIARVSARQIAQLSEVSDQRGLLFERRG